MKIFARFGLLFDLLAILVLLFLINLTLPVKTSKILYIPKGGHKYIVTYLKDEHVSNLFTIDAYILRFIGNPQQGWLDLEGEEFLKGNFLKKLTLAKAASTKLTLIPGETAYIFLQELAKNRGLDFDKLWENYEEKIPYKDGFFLANSYEVPYGLDEEKLITFLYDLSLREQKKMSEEFLGSYDEEKWKEVLSKASVIQKEAADKDEMPLVSSVIDNRLAKNMKLQMDGTLNYGKYSHIKITPQRLKDDNSSYNTYLNFGLPEEPVCAVSADAIKAALQPEKSPYLYFYRDKRTGKHIFSENYKEHLRAIKAN